MSESQCVVLYMGGCDGRFAADKEMTVRICFAS